MYRRDRIAELPLLFRGSEAVAAGVLTSAQLRGPLVRRVLRGIYRPVAVPDSHELRCRAAGMVLPPRAMITGRSAATARGIPLATTRDPVEVLCHPEARLDRRPEITVRKLEHLPARPERWHGTWLAPPYRMAFDLAARRSVGEGVAALDAVCRSGGLDLAGWRTWLEDQHGHGVVAVRAAAELVDPRAGSTPESLLRVVLVRAGIDVEPQHEVRVRGRLVARVDLALVQWRVAVEYDGAWHVLREQLERDRARLNALREAGWTVVHVTAAMLRDPEQVVQAVLRARSLAIGGLRAV